MQFSKNRTLGLKLNFPNINAVVWRRYYRNFPRKHHVVYVMFTPITPISWSVTEKHSRHKQTQAFSHITWSFFTGAKIKGSNTLDQQTKETPQTLRHLSCLWSENAKSLNLSLHLVCVIFIYYWSADLKKLRQKTYSKLFICLFRWVCVIPFVKDLSKVKKLQIFKKTQKTLKYT